MRGAAADEAFDGLQQVRRCAARQPFFKGLQQVWPSRCPLLKEMKEMGFSKGLQQLRSCAARQPRASGAVPPWVPPLPPPPVSIWRGDGPAASISRGDGPGRLDGRPFRAMARSPRYPEPCSQTNCSHFSGAYISSQAARVPYLSSRTRRFTHITHKRFSGPYINSCAGRERYERYEFRIFHHAPGASRVRTSAVRAMAQLA